jgi:hypothetical protein
MVTVPLTLTESKEIDRPSDQDLGLVGRPMALREGYVCDGGPIKLV